MSPETPASKRPGDKFSIPVSEVPNFFLQPETYIPGFKTEPSALKVMRNEEGQVKKARWPGELEEGDTVKPIDVDIKAPGFFANGLARARRKEAAYKLKIKPR